MSAGRKKRASSGSAVNTDVGFYLFIYLFVYLISQSRAVSLASPCLNAACVRLLFLRCVCGAGRSRAYVGARQAGRQADRLPGWRLCKELIIMQRVKRRRQAADTPLLLREPHS